MGGHNPVVTVTDRGDQGRLGAGPLSLLLSQVAEWGKTRTDIAAVLLVGSHARNQARAESDVDLVILAAEPGRLLENRDWLGRFGVVWAVGEEDWGRVRSLRVAYGSGLEVEYGLTDETWLAEPLDPGTQTILEDGVRIVFLRNDSVRRTLERFLSPEPEPELPPGGGTDRLTRAMAYAGAVLTLAVTLGVFAIVARNQPLWPLPGVYFVELLVLAVSAASLAAAGHRAAETVLWIALGAMLGFVWMGRLSVGMAYAPGTIAFGVAAIASTRHRQGVVIRSAALAALACLAQIGIILLLV